MRGSAEVTLMTEFTEKLSCPLKGHLLTAVSGGADSVFLFMLMLTLQRMGGLEFETVHVNHGLRGAASDADEAFVRSLCEENHIPCHVKRLDLQERKDEASARLGRYRAFAAVMEKTGAEGVVLAHHRDDQTETFLLHLLRGAGPEGLSGIKAETTVYGVRILRPLLGTGRKEIREWLCQAGIPWREDESNADTAYARNALRQILIPEMEKIFPGAASRIAGASELIRLDHETLEREAEQYVLLHSERLWIETDVLRTMPEAIRVRVLRRWWRSGFAEGMDEKALSMEQTERLDALVMGEGRGKCNLPGGLVAEKGRHHLHMTGMPVKIPEPVALTGTGVRFGQYILEIVPGGISHGNGKNCQEFPKEELKDCVIRTRQPGDMIRPFGSKGRQKLQDYLVNRGVDAPWRDSIPLICRENDVLWVAGIGTGCIPEWNPDREQQRLVWKTAMPWQAK